MARNKMNDLRDHLFAQLERLNDESITPEEIDQEVKKAKAITQVANVIVNSARVEVDYVKTTGGLKTESPLFENFNQKGIE